MMPGHHVVELVEDENLRRHMEEINYTLNALEEYMIANRYCREMLPLYEWTMETCGLRHSHVGC